uniref:Uncharacterized protein n=1 Tax=Anopheles farauti TaxID=69004 RepID=A0A182Q975_9DIPT
MLCRRMRLTERHLQPPREPLAGPIVRPCTARKLMNLDTDPPGCPNSPAHSPTVDERGSGNGEGQPCSPRGRKAGDGPKTPLMIVNLNIPPGTETLAPKSATRSERHKLPHFCMQYRNLTGRLCSAPPGCTGPAGVPTVVGTSGTGSALIPQIFIQSFELQDRRAVDGQGGGQGDDSGGQSSQQYNIITENEEDTFATLLLDNISNISLEMIQRHQQKLLGTTASTITEGPMVTGATGSGTCFQHAEGCSSLERTESKTSTEGLLPLDGRMDSLEERRERQASRGQSASGPPVDRLAVTQEGQDDPNSDIPAGYRSLCYRTPSPKTRQIIRVDIVTSREKY